MEQEREMGKNKTGAQGIERQMNRTKGRRIRVEDGWINGWMDGWMEGGKEGRASRVAVVREGW